MPMLFAPLPMHIPDGFLSVLVSIAFWILSLLVISLALRRLNRDLGERQVPLMGVLAAAIFAGQMLNFTVAGGTSGHLTGAAIAAILLGPWAAILVLTTVVGIQALIFQDGGLLALGANIFNMAVIGVTVAYFVYHTLQKLSRNRSWGIFLGGFLAAWVSIMTSALAVALQLALSGTAPASIAVPAMAGIHALIGIGEGLITLGALTFLFATRRDLLSRSSTRPSGSLAIWISGLLIAVFLAVLAPLASTHPDGLESVAMRLGFISASRGSPLQFIPGYLFPGISNSALATILAGLLGLLLVSAVSLIVALTRRRHSREKHPPSGDE